MVYGAYKKVFKEDCIMMLSYVCWKSTIDTDIYLLFIFY